MTDVEILLSKDTSQQQKLDATTRIIKTYDLPLTQEEVMKIFKKTRNDDQYYYQASLLEYYSQIKFLFNTILNNNKNMFIAITKAHINSQVFCRCGLDIFVRKTGTTYNIGQSSSIHILYTYHELLDYYDFDVNDLIINEDEKLEILQYRDEKYSGKLTKVAIKN